MATRRFLTQRELVEAMEEVLNELDDEQEGALNAVYIPPKVDELTDEYVLLNEIPLDGEIAGTFEIDVGSDDALHYESDEEPLSEKRRKLVQMNIQKSKEPKWEKKEVVTRTRFPVSNEMDILMKKFYL
ncbi:hypothetical protein MML48_1g01504 [Holotrichia oblita]|uniref:Uncharacterized protein n=1 Tax=Holotrichia oblita TaxID=644536 RepID=A0ACB9TRT5_HOLOL|nr:hypothetical protein MML48_1g01504 [Holotrichia oblita]